MSAVNPGFGAITLRDLQHAHNAGTIQRTVIDAITKKNGMMDDLTFFQASDGDRDITEIITGTPKMKFYQLGEGKLPSAGSRQSKSYAPARAYVMLSILRDKYNQMAEKGREQKYLQDEVDAQVAALGEGLVESFLYGDRADNAKGLNGLAKYYSKYGGTSELSPYTRVFDAFPTKDSGITKANEEGNDAITDLRSIFIVGWGDKGVKPFYPEGAKDGGLHFGNSKMDDVARTDPENGGTVHYLEREFTWHCGLSLVDPRKCCRIANIPKNKMLTATDYDKELLEKLMLATDMCRTNAEKKVIYMDPYVWTYLKILLTRLTMSNAFELKQIMERPTETLFGIPVRTNESQEFAEELVPLVS